MNNSPIKFRENAILAVQRNSERIEIHFRGIPTPITLRFASLSQPVRDEGLGYGMEVRLTRQAALGHDSKSGKPATAQEKYDAVKRLADHLNSGSESWTMAYVGGGGFGADTRVLIEALVRAFGLTADAAEAAVRDMSGAERDALRVDAEVKPHLDAIYAERARSAGAAGMIVQNLKDRLRQKA